jgi:Xaa-Pro aminopeptidase
MRYDRVVENLKSLGLKAFISDHPPNLFYLTEVFPQVGRLLVSDEEMILFVDGRYGEIAKKWLLAKLSSPRRWMRL